MFDDVKRFAELDKDVAWLAGHEETEILCPTSALKAERLRAARLAAGDGSASREADQKTGQAKRPPLR